MLSIVETPGIVAVETHLTQSQSLSGWVRGKSVQWYVRVFVSAKRKETICREFLGMALPPITHQIEQDRPIFEKAVCAGLTLPEAHVTYILNGYGLTVAAIDW